MKVSYEINEFVMSNKQELSAGESASNSQKKTNEYEYINFR